MLSCIFQGNRDERETVDISLVQQDAQVGSASLSLRANVCGSICKWFVHTFSIARLIDCKRMPTCAHCRSPHRPCMLLEKTSLEPTSPSLMLFCVREANLTSEQVFSMKTYSQA